MDHGAKDQDGRYGFLTLREKAPLAIEPEMPERYSCWTYMMKRNMPWRSNECEVAEKQGKCCWNGCPGKSASKAECPRSSDTYMCCDEYSIRMGRDVYHCNSHIKGGMAKQSPSLSHLPP